MDSQQQYNDILDAYEAALAKAKKKKKTPPPPDSPPITIGSTRG